MVLAQDFALIVIQMFKFLKKCIWHKWEHDKPNSQRASDGWWTSTCKRKCKSCDKEQTGLMTAGMGKWDWLWGDWIKQCKKEEMNKRRSFEF